MNQEHIQEIKKAVQETVNGQINNLSRKLDDYIVDDTEWKKRAESVILMGENVQGFGKVSLYIVGFIASVGGAVMIILNLLKDE